MKRRKVVLMGCAITLALLVPIAAIVMFVRQARQAPITQSEVEKELNEIAPPPDATVTQHNVSNKWTQGVIGNYYRSSLSYAQIRAHYDAQLIRRGWKFKEIIPLTNWGKDLGESQTIYCRGRYAADIYFTGNGPNYPGFRYAFNITWGLGHCP